MKNNLGIGLLCAATALASLNAHGARPFATEDAGSLAKGACELEPVLEQERAPGEPSVRTSTLQGACGLGAGTQVGLGLSSTRAADLRVRGLALTGKTQLVEGAEGQPSWTVAYGADWERSTAGKGYTLSSVAALLVASVPVGSWGTVHANLGWQQQRPDKVNSGIWALALEKPVSSTVDVGLETYGDGRSPAWLGTGLRFTPTSGISLNASAAQQTGKEPVKAYSLGMKFDF